MNPIIRPSNTGYENNMLRRDGQAGPGQNQGRRSAADLDRDARTEAEQLKVSLASQPPWSRDVETSRQRCRSLHMLILFSHPLSPYAQSLDTLWHHTTYLLIQAYREMVASLERSLPPPGGPGQSRQNRRGGSGPGTSQPVQSELKKALTRFRQALASEETFYRSLISRIVRFYHLADTSNCAEYLAEARIPLGERDGYRDRDQTDVEERSVSGPSPTLSAEEKKAKLGLVYKGLICLGDIERYKEQYGEAQTHGQRRGKQGARGDEKYGNAKRFYEIARGLQPDDGAAFNQLAVITTYLNDDLATTYYYFRALAIRHAFKGADGILFKFLGKATERWREKQKAMGGVDEEGEELEQWKEEVVALTGILYTKAGFTFLPPLQASVAERLPALLRSRRLGAEQVVKLTTIIIGSHYRARSTAGIEQDPKLIQRSHDAETKALDFLLSTFAVLLRVGAEEVEEARSALGKGSALAIEGDGDEVMDGDDLAQSISAVLRRILPSLRLISKWLKLDLEYLSRLAPYDEAEIADVLPHFLETYKRFIAAIATVFPIINLPSLSEPLEEDIDMKGFAPLQRGITAESGANNATSDQGELGGNGVTGEVHPNEEQLMRLADLQVDAKLIMQSELGASLLGIVIPPNLLGQPRDGEEDGDLASVSTETEDDPVNMAMRATLGAGSSVDGESVNGGEEWVYGAPSFTAQPAVSPRVGDVSTPNATPSRPKTTAIDLLQNLMLESTPSPSQTPPPPSHIPSPLHPSLVPPPSAPAVHGHTAAQASGSGNNLLFGGATQVQGAGNIWTLTREESEKGQRRASAGATTGAAATKPPGLGVAASATATGPGTHIAALWATPTPTMGNLDATHLSNTLSGNPDTSYTSPAAGYSYSVHQASYAAPKPTPSAYPTQHQSVSASTNISNGWGNAVPYPSYGQSQGPFPAPSGAGGADVPYYAQAAYYKSPVGYGWNGQNGQPP